MKKNRYAKKNPPAIVLKHITKQYVLQHEKPTFSEQFFSRKKKEKITALSNIDLTVYKGERVGIIGSNGSGKTTLLKIISGITVATTGNISISGKVISLIDLEAGFHPELSGEENIFLNGLIIGMSKEKIAQHFSDIVAFAGIGKFIDAPLYTYSEGMKLRLGFSIAVFADPDILILDEGIGVGDEYFRKKCSIKIQEFFSQGKTIIISTHWIEYLRENCDRILWLEGGAIKQMGNVALLDKYKQVLVEKNV